NWKTTILPIFHQFCPGRELKDVAWMIIFELSQLHPNAQLPRTTAETTAQTTAPPPQTLKAAEELLWASLRQQWVSPSWCWPFWASLDSDTLKDGAGFVGFRYFKRRRGHAYKNDEEVLNVGVSRDTAGEWNPVKFHFVIRGLWTTLNAVYVGVWSAAPETSREDVPQSIPSWGQAAEFPYAMATNYTPRIVKEWVFFRAIGQILVTYIFNQTEPVTRERITELVQTQARELFGVDAPADTMAIFATKCIELEKAMGPGGVQVYLPSAGDEFNDDKHEVFDDDKHEVFDDDKHEVFDDDKHESEDKERGGQSIIGILPGFIENKTGTMYHKAKVRFVA
ncbi:hypothetical protein HK104_004577, partial [Borealophlyctis nickersoniae]